MRYNTTLQLNSGAGVLLTPLPHLTSHTKGTRAVATFDSKTLLFGKQPNNHATLFLLIRLNLLWAFALFAYLSVAALYRSDLIMFVIFALYALIAVVPIVDTSVLVSERAVEPTELVPPIAEELPLHTPTTENWLSYPLGQYVYVIQDTDLSRCCKIGRTNNLRRRLARFDVVLPFRFAVICIVPCRNAVSMETYLHNHFNDKRRSGEWFSLDEKDVAFIRELAQRTRRKHGR